MNLELTDEETAAPLRELDGIIDSDRYFMPQRIKTLKAIRAKIRLGACARSIAAAEAFRATAGDSGAETARGAMKSRPGPPMPLGAAAAARVRLILWCRVLRSPG